MRLPRLHVWILFFWKLFFWKLFFWNFFENYFFYFLKIFLKIIFFEIFLFFYFLIICTFIDTTFIFYTYILPQNKKLVNSCFRKIFFWSRTRAHENPFCLQKIQKSYFVTKNPKTHSIFLIYLHPYYITIPPFSFPPIFPFIIIFIKKNI